MKRELPIMYSTMIIASFVSSITMHIVILSMCASTTSAPAHHLAIGVQGNTPTLIVTSSEIGLTSETKLSQSKIPKAQKNLKTNNKLKSQKMKSSANHKKSKPAFFTKGTIGFHLATHPNPLNETLDASNRSLTTTTSPDTWPRDDHQFVQILDSSDGTTTQETSSLTSPASIYSIQKSTVATFLREPTMNTTADTENVKSIEKQTSSNEFILLTTKAPMNEASTPKSQTENAIETTAMTASTLSPPTSLPLISSDGVVTTAATIQTTIYGVVHDDSHPTKDNQSDVTLEISTFTTAADSNVWIRKQTPKEAVTITENAETNGASGAQAELHSATETTSLSTDFVDGESTTKESVIKLIDLEKHNLKSFESSSQPGVGPDNGHDGLKTIRKKQLVNEHYLDVKVGTKNEETNPKPAHIPIQHGFLGPILMEEKTFHVIHANNTTTTALNKTQPLTIHNAQLLHDNFVEIKAAKVDNTPPATTVVSTVNKSRENLANGHDAKQQHHAVGHRASSVLSSTIFEVADSGSTKIPSKAANTMFKSTIEDKSPEKEGGNKKTESKISDIQIEVYDSTIDSIVASTNFKDADIPQLKTTKPPSSPAQQERFTQYVIDRTETSTQESINYSTIQVASGLPEPAAIEIHINVSESLGNDGDDLDISFPQAEFANNGRGEDAYADDVKEKDDIKLKVPSNTANSANKYGSDEILVVEIVDNVDNATEPKGLKTADDLLPISAKDVYSTPPAASPPPPYHGNFDRDSDTIFYISNTEVKVGESMPAANKALDERKLKLENQFFPANYMASTHPNVNNGDEGKDHHMYEEDILLSSDRNQADSLKIYRNLNEPSPPLDVTYVGESIIEVEQLPDTGITTTFANDRFITPQPDVIIQPAILPEISIGVPVIGELPPQIELKEIEFMPNEAHLRRSGIYGNDEASAINAVAGSSDVENRIDDTSIQYGGDLIDESADGGFDGVEGSYPFGNPVSMAQRKPNHVADYGHLYINYGVNNMRKDELTADVKESVEVAVVAGNSESSVNEQNSTFSEFLNKVALNNITSLNESERMSNVTAFSIMEDTNDLYEKSTEDIINLISLAIGLFIVILPVVVTCSMLWALRYLYKKYHSNSTDSNGNLDPADTKGHPSEDAAEKGECEQDSYSLSHSDKDDIRNCPETFPHPSIDNSGVKFSAPDPSHVDSSLVSHCNMYSNPSKSRECPLSLPLHPMSSETQTVHDGTSQGPNGSVTKMTLENNLLIVETEERNDISRMARETKMDYNKDGVFVVEVARGIDSKTIPESPVTEGPEKMISMFEPKYNGTMGYKVANEKVSHNNEKVQIHSPPPEKTDDGPRSLHQIEEVDEPGHSPLLCGVEAEGVCMTYKPKTGLSQSDLSSTSSNDSNKDYCYGNQELYVVDNSGYCTSSPMANVALKCDSKDIEDDDRNSEDGRYLEHTPNKEEDAKETDDVLNEISGHKEADTVDKNCVAQDQKDAGKDDEISNGNCEQSNHLVKSVNDDDDDDGVDHTQCNGFLGSEPITDDTPPGDPEVKRPNDQTDGYAEKDISNPINSAIGEEKSASQTEYISENEAIVPKHLSESMDVPMAEHFEEEATPVIAVLQCSEQETDSVVNGKEDTGDESSRIANDCDTLPDVVPVKELVPIPNGVLSCEAPSNCTAEFENGFDSIMSLPDPPTSDEILCGELSDHQLDSLPPPPPPLFNELGGEAFSLKDLPPPLANAEIECLPTEESTNCYASLPPPPPTTLDVTVTASTNGNMHASPLTPPASPPPHYINGLHTVMCPPIAVDVNGS